MILAECVFSQFPLPKVLQCIFSQVGHSAGVGGADFRNHARDIKHAPEHGPQALLPISDNRNPYDTQVFAH
eukprot:scaffold12164_cov64-Phaeocystis_antarctica.AAC.3